MPHGRDPLVEIVRGRREVDLHAFRIHRRAQERHVILPADHCADAPNLRVENGKRRPISLPPDDALQGCRHQLAMLSEEASVTPVEEHAAVERPGVLLDDADSEVDSVRSRDRAEPVACGTGCRDRTGPIPSEQLAAGRRPPADNRSEGETLRVRGDERLGEEHEISTLGSCLTRELSDLLDRPIDIEDHRCVLNDRDAHAIRKLGHKRLMGLRGWNVD